MNIKVTKYALKHPKKGWVKSKLHRYSPTWADDETKAKLWNQRNHLSSMLTQTTSDILRECVITEVTISFFLRG